MGKMREEGGDKNVSNFHFFTATYAGAGSRKRWGMCVKH